jgi:two-component system, NarL family, nitrate/nitrite response regulator NarL
MRILVADDHPLYREAAATQIQRLFREAHIDQVASLDELRSFVEEPGSVFDLFLIDFHMPGITLDALTDLVQRYPNTPLAVVSGTAQRAEIRSAIRFGVRGFIPKTATGDYLAHALKLLLAGGTSVPTEVVLDGEEMAATAINGTGAAPWLRLLTQRETEVLKGVTRGLSNKEIARELNLAEVTIKLHLRSVFRKIGARSRADAAVMAAKSGLA